MQENEGVVKAKRGVSSPLEEKVEEKDEEQEVSPLSIRSQLGQY